MVQRPRQSPLHIDDLADPYPIPSLVSQVTHDIIKNAIRQQIPRIQELSLFTPEYQSGSNQTPFFSSLNTAAPMLKSLELSIRGLPRETIDFPSDFLGGHFPLLRKIVLNLQASDSWTMLSSGRLVYLHIRLDTPSSSYDPLLDLSAANPGLQDVSLRGCLPGLSAPYRDRKAIGLPSLKILGLTSWDTNCANILQVLRIPVTADLILHIDPSPDMFRSLFAELRAYFSRGSTHEFRHIFRPHALALASQSI